jgi:hypothetical protein
MAINALSDALGNTLPVISHCIAAIGGLGTAAYGLVDASKGVMGGVSNAGFSFIREAVAPLIGAADGSAEKQAPTGVGPQDILRTLRANWLNGVAKADQKAIAKSLIRLTITPDNAPRLAARTGVDPKELTAVADRIRAGTPLLPQDVNVLGRFDAIVSALLDEGYERGDQQYRNTSKLAAALVAIVLAVVAGGIIDNVSNSVQAMTYLASRDCLVAILVGAIATPLAPVAKDLSSSLAAAVKALSSTKR